MDTDIFLKKMKQQINVNIVDLNSLFYFSYYKNLIDLKNLTEYIKFPCNFNNKGICNSIETKKTLWPRSQKCCCNKCEINYGHFRLIFKKDIPYYAKNWNTKTGFWRKGKGCILDRDKRSIICLTYFCNSDEKLRRYLLSLSDAMNKLQKDIIESIKKRKQ